MPGRLREWAQQTARAQGDWRRLLAAALRQSLHHQTGANDYTWQKPPRRCDPDDPVPRPALTAAIGHIAVALDTSGCMRPDDHAQAFSEIDAILTRAVPGTPVTVLSVDHDTQHIQRVNQARAANVSTLSMSASTGRSSATCTSVWSSCSIGAERVAAFGRFPPIPLTFSIGNRYHPLLLPTWSLKGYGMHFQDRPGEHVSVSLDRIREQLWDSETGLYRVPPGAVGNRAVRKLNLHSIRESALAALQDLAIGNTERAEWTLNNVLEHQYPASTQPWSGTFKVTAQETTPPTDAVPYFHYDPNWRQFMGLILMQIWKTHQHDISQSLLDKILTAVEACVEQEPPDRIPLTYTNPALMKVWLQGQLGQVRSDRQLVADAERTIDDLIQRLDKYGDLDEYNSPTYDGICLTALALWQYDAPSTAFAEGGTRLLDTLCERISDLYHPELKAMSGPHVRAYHISFQTYVSLLGLWWTLLGNDGTLPSPLHLDTTHCHDLFFLPLLDSISKPIRERLKPIPVTSERVHVQEFGNIYAKSLLTESHSIGLETGRRGKFARDQYTPVVVHWPSAVQGVTQSLGLQVDNQTNLDAEHDGESGASLLIHRLDRANQTALTIKILASDELAIDHKVMRMGPCTVWFNNAPDLLVASPCDPSLLTLQWTDQKFVEGHLQLGQS